MLRPFPLATKCAGSLSTGESSCEQGKIATESLLNPAGRDDAASDPKPNRALAGGLAILTSATQRKHPLFTRINAFLPGPLRDDSLAKSSTPDRRALTAEKISPTLATG